MRDALNTSIHDVTARFLRMQSLTLEQIAHIRTALTERHYVGLGARVSELEQEIDVLEREVEQACLTAIARYQPVAGDLRFFLMVFKSLADLERAGDYGRHIGRDLEELSSTMRSGPLTDVLPMMNVLGEMVERLAYAFAEHDADAARTVMRLDIEVDALYEQLQRASLTRILEDPRELQASLKTTRMARSLERLGDHVVNVAERVDAFLAARPGAETAPSEAAG
ncbi:phosphate signaling complex protein PhoU [Deinococcus maricopensis]|uniref:Phosphate-specific transport system accessory protein PhoU n=1 Tax=Deinococcus maricopensis (strain DSM 21211 / LMG 22137 / NRRL B-23946 / LB-34) TaxID=709986 RepID=E8UA65_DEIML|nr:phosphate signaling complex protein PhoU [Deinococcus maricopensis]ADV67954.1 phosphate uptake regulator, PhoU [Deinococcus maricopensis DSM 21211]